MLRKLVAAPLITVMLAAGPALAQTPAPGPTPPTPQQPGTAGGGPPPTTAPGTEEFSG